MNFQVKGQCEFCMLPIDGSGVIASAGAAYHLACAEREGIGQDEPELQSTLAHFSVEVRYRGSQTYRVVASSADEAAEIAGDRARWEFDADDFEAGDVDPVSQPVSEDDVDEYTRDKARRDERAARKAERATERAAALAKARTPESVSSTTCAAS